MSDTTERPTYQRNGIVKELVGSLITYGQSASESSFSATVRETPDEVKAIRDAATSDFELLEFRNMYNTDVPSYIRAESIISITPFWDRVENHPIETP